MTMDKQVILEDTFRVLVANKVIKTKKEFAAMLGVSYTSLISAMNGDPRYLTDAIIAKAQFFYKDHDGKTRPAENLIPLLPIGARAGSLIEYSEGVMGYQCEMIASPIKGVTFAVQVTGESMAPEYPNGCHVLVKKVDADIFIEWGRVYVLDTDNGIVIKEVFPTADPEEVECRSINPKFAPYKVRREYIIGWYRVLMSMSLK